MMGLGASRNRGAVWLAALVLLGVVFRPAMGGTAMVRPHPSVAPAPLVFDGVTVIDVREGRLLPAQRVVIVGNHIRAMGGVGTVQVPRGARVVDARGKYLIPGLWDMHVHPSRATELFYPLFLANGVTGIRDAGSPVPLDTLLLWRREIVAGTRLGPPRQILSGQSISSKFGLQLFSNVTECNRSKQQQENQLETCAADLADARHVVDSLKAAGADMIKARQVNREMYFVIAAEARRLHIPFGGHAWRETAIEASDSGASIVDHVLAVVDFCWRGEPKASAEHCQAVAERLRHNGTWNVPTLFAYTGFYGRRAHQIFDRFTARITAFWVQSLSLSQLHGNWLRAPASTDSLDTPDSVGPLHLWQQVGLPILAGTDIIAGSDKREIGPGFALHAELAMYVAEGMTPLYALQAATLNPAILLHATDSLGTVAPGKLADLVLLDANPLDDITNTTTIRAVVANGRYYDRAALDSILVTARALIKEDPQPLGTSRK